MKNMTKEEKRVWNHGFAAGERWAIEVMKEVGNKALKEAVRQMNEENERVEQELKE